MPESGIEKELAPPSSSDLNLFDLTQTERDMLGIKNLPISLNQAIALAKKSDFVRELLGDNLMKTYLAAKEDEYERYRTKISPWEVEEYLLRY